MAPDPPPSTTTIIHATIGLETLQRCPMPPVPDVNTEFLQNRQTQERNLFCTVYTALLDDVEAFDCQMKSQFSREIIRIVRTFATSLGIDNQDIPKLQDFSQRLARLAHKCQQTDAVQGLSGATVVDYLVALMAEKSACGSVKLSTLENYQYQLAQLKLANVLREVIMEDKEVRAKKAKSKKIRAKDVRYKEVSDEKVSEEVESRKTLLRSIGLPSVLFICIGPHNSNQEKYKNKKNRTEKNHNAKTQHNGDRMEKDHKERIHEEANEKNNYEEMDKEEKSPDGHGNLHVVASSGETFADVDLKEWAERMHHERMRSLSLQNYQQVCATERAFFTTLASGSGSESSNDGAKNEMDKVRRANIVPYWQTMHHWPDASALAAGRGTGTQARIGVFNHACETAGAFNVHTGFERRARCFKCASIYLYHQDLDAVRAEADMNGCHRTEITYDWVANESSDGNDGKSLGPSCAEALGHLLCSEIMR